MLEVLARILVLIALCPLLLAMTYFVLMLLDSSDDQPPL